MAIVVRRDAGLYGYERALRRAGFDLIAGADEAGRGACAGPLVAASVILGRTPGAQIAGLRDSKLLTPAQRERCYAEILAKAVAWSVVLIEPGECDRLGMHVANIQALRRAVCRLDVGPDFVLTDGFGVDGLGVPSLAVWKGDAVAGDLRGRGVRDRQGDPRPADARRPRTVAGVPFRRPQGLLHPAASTASGRLRAERDPPVQVRERPPGRRAGAGFQGRPPDGDR